MCVIGGKTVNLTAYEKVAETRKNKRPSGGYFIENLIENFIELHGDRRFGDDGAIIGGIGFFNREPVTVIGVERGDTIEERLKRHFGCPKPEGYRKALRLMKEAEKFNRPIVCFIGTPGAYCGVDAEERGQGEAIAENLYEMMGITVPIISIIVGEGGSGGALALGVGNRVAMLENSVYSVISPEGCAAILWKDSSKADIAAEALKLTAQDLYSFGVIEKIICEENLATKEVCKNVKDYICEEINALKKMTKQELLDQRYEKFRKIGK